MVLNFSCTLELPGYSHLTLWFQLTEDSVLRPLSRPIKLNLWSWDPGTNLFKPAGSSHIKLSCEQVVRCSVSYVLWASESLGGRGSLVYNAFSAMVILGQSLNLCTPFLTSSQGSHTTCSQTTLWVSRVEGTLDFFLPEPPKQEWHLTLSPPIGPSLYLMTPLKQHLNWWPQKISPACMECMSLV